MEIEATISKEFADNCKRLASVYKCEVLQNNELGFNRVFIKLAGDEKDLKLLNTAVVNSLKK